MIDWLEANRARMILAAISVITICAGLAASKYITGIPSLASGPAIPTLTASAPLARPSLTATPTRSRSPHAIVHQSPAPGASPGTVTPGIPRGAVAFSPDPSRPGSASPAPTASVLAPASLSPSPIQAGPSSSVPPTMAPPPVPSSTPPSPSPSTPSPSATGSQGCPTPKDCSPVPVPGTSGTTAGHGTGMAGKNGNSDVHGADRFAGRGCPNASCSTSTGTKGKRTTGNRSRNASAAAISASHGRAGAASSPGVGSIHAPNRKASTAGTAQGQGN